MARSRFLCWNARSGSGSQPRRDVGDAHGGVGGVDVLSALTAGAIRIDAEVLGLDDDVDAVVDLRRHEDAGEGGVTSLGLIERRNSLRDDERRSRW